MYALGEGKLPQQKIRAGLLAGAVIGYLGKHNATLSGAEGGCQAEIGVASAMGAAVFAQASDEAPQVVANAAESALQHHLVLTCAPVAAFVQVPCIERCAFGAVKAWTGYMIAQLVGRTTGFAEVGATSTTRPRRSKRGRVVARATRHHPAGLGGLRSGDQRRGGKEHDALPEHERVPHFTGGASHDRLRCICSPASRPPRRSGRPRQGAEDHRLPADVSCTSCRGKLPVVT